MSSISYTHGEGDPYITKVVETDNQTARVTEKTEPYAVLYVDTSDGRVTGGGDAETVTVSVCDGLEIVRGTDRAGATTIDHSGDVTLTIDGAEVSKTLTSGSVEFGLTTEKAAGETIEIVAESLADVPAESDSAEIEVIQA